MEQPRGTSTVVGVFDDYPTAERAVRDLTSNGIPRDAIDVNSNFMSESAGGSGGVTREREGGISGFFHLLFGSDEESESYAGGYAEAVRRGNSVVTVNATEDQIDRAIEIMNQHGAIDIDRRISEYKETGYKRYDPNAPAYSAEEASRERERMRKSGEERVIPVVEEEMQVGKRTVRRGGVRIVSHVIERPVEEHKVDKPISAAKAFSLREQSFEVEEISEEPVVSKRAETEYSRDFRRHYDSNLANSGLSWDTAGPAYRYGSKMAGDPRCKGKSWSDMESTLRSDYERQYPESTWEKIKDAVRYGWDRVT